MPDTDLPQEVDAAFTNATEPGASTADTLTAAGYTVTKVDPSQAVLDLHTAGQLGYLAASDEWIDGHGEPLDDLGQEAAWGLMERGRLPEFEDVCHG